MESHLLPIVFTFLTLALAASHAALPPEEYWNSVLPNTPMPSAIKDLLNPADDVLEDKSTSVNVGKGGVNVNTGKGKHGSTYVGVGKGSGVNVHAGKGKPGSTSVGVGKGGVNVHAGQGKPGSTSVGVGKGGVNVHAGQGNPNKGTNVGVGKGGVNVKTGPKKKPVFVGVTPGANPFLYKYAATETQLHDDPTIALFFLQNDIKPGSKLNLQFPKTTSTSASFLPRHVADSIPYSSNKLPEILNHFSVKPGTLEAEIIKNTINECEAPGIKGEDKYCATSLESMIDFTTSKLGKTVIPISTEVKKEITPAQQYTVSTGVKKIGGESLVVCHKQNYPYAVFYCHSTESTTAYKVPLEGADGAKVSAVAVCHRNTGEWNPKHLAFQVLKVKPGSVPVCHFLPQDHVVWVEGK